MASKRVAASAINWAAIAERVPERQRDAYRIFKTASDKYVTRVADLPEALPKIDFSDYKSRIGNKAMVAEFEKMYTALEVPYPQDNQNWKTKLDGELKVALEGFSQFKAEQNLKIDACQKILNAIDSVPPPEKMTRQMFNYYFPNAGINPNRDNPRMWPQHMDSVQIDKMPKFDNRPDDCRNMVTLELWEKAAKDKIEAQEKAMAEKQKLEAAKEVKK